MMGERLAHGTPFRCAWEDGLLDNSRVVQVFFLDIFANVEFVSDVFGVEPGTLF